MNSKGRSLLAAVVTVVASVAIFTTLLAHYMNGLANSSGFAGGAVRVVHSRPVETLIVNAATSRILGEVGAPSAVRPIVSAAVREALSNGKVTAEIRAAAATLQSQLASGKTGALILTLPDLGPVIAPVVEARDPPLGSAVGRIGTITVVDAGIPSTASSAIHDLTGVGRDASLLIVLSVALVALALLLSPDRRSTFMGLGLGALAGGLLAAGIYVFGRELVVSAFAGSTSRTAVRAAWSAYLGGLPRTGLVLAGVGAVVFLAALLRRGGRAPRSHGYVEA